MFRYLGWVPSAKKVTAKNGAITKREAIAKKGAITKKESIAKKGAIAKNAAIAKIKGVINKISCFIPKQSCFFLAHLFMNRFGLKFT